MKTSLRVLCGTFFLACAAQAQEPPYVPPADPAVQRKLEWWGDLKFGLLMHWGPYSQWGIVESWSLCSEDEPWCRRKGPYAENYAEYLEAYKNLKTTFNPGKFNPEKWASAAADAGMRYVVFTTKHHDGFCMFDTHQTDYKITSQQCQFHSNPKADVTKAIFEAFRNKSFGIGAYFSKPDWNNDDYWWRRFATPDRNVNYDPAKYPERWQRFKDFTYNQIQELMSGYGGVDILWLDGGWVRPLSGSRPSWAKSPYNQDIDMPRIAAMARKLQPGLIVVDRSVHGEYENYRTPEQEIPEKPLGYPWETCMTMASSWSYVPNDSYKPSRKLIHMLIDVVSKGGNFLLNIGPGPDGEWHDTAYQRLKDIGSWMRINGEAIYTSRPLPPYAETRIRYTRNKAGDVAYAFFLADESEGQLPSEIMLYSMQPREGSDIYLLGAAQQSLKWKKVNRGTLISIPEALQKNPPCQYAWVLKLSVN
jgi:alpha-L-fucosidase